MNQKWWSRLSPKMRWVYLFARRGLTPKEIGRRLLMSEFTVRMFLENIESRRHPR
jgi:DNA-binding CsgD family transcriptional regulator